MEITELCCFRAVPDRAAATDHEVQGDFSQFLNPGNPEITEDNSIIQQLSREQLTWLTWHGGIAWAKALHPFPLA